MDAHDWRASLAAPPTVAECCFDNDSHFMFFIDVDVPSLKHGYFDGGRDLLMLPGAEYCFLYVFFDARILTQRRSYAWRVVNCFVWLSISALANTNCLELCISNWSFPIANPRVSSNLVCFTCLV
jgi:hypothetical protein